MSVAFYMDEHVESAITKALRKRGVDVLTAQEDGRDRSPDARLLDRATELGRVLVSRDRDFLIESARRQRARWKFAGVIYAARPRVPIGRCIEDLEIIAKATEPHEYTNRVEYLPL